MDEDYDEDFSLSQRMASHTGQGALLDSQTASVNLVDYPENSRSHQPFANLPSGRDAMDSSGVNLHSEVRRIRGKTIRDPIHGDMYLVPAACSVMDTYPVQRLRDLKQVGATSYVFPGAIHSRFEHSLGVAHLAYRYAERLMFVDGSGEKRMTRQQYTALTLAGMCHDLGHGPFSHLFERSFLPAVNVRGWSHEDMSVKLFEYIVDDGVLERHKEVDETVIQQVKDMIVAADKNSGSKPKGWIYELVANGRNGLDVDKFDYLARDSYYAGVKIAADFERINKFSMIIDDEICYKFEEYRNVFEVYHARATMHDAVYLHRKVKAVDLMIAEALVAAEPALRLQDMLHDVDLFLSLDDTVLKDIEFYGIKRPRLQINEDAENALKKAQGIVQRLRRRDLYKFAGEALIPPQEGLRLPEPADLVKLNELSGVRLKEKDIIVDSRKVDYTSGDSNPVDKVKFFEKHNPTRKFLVKEKLVTWNLPQNFSERRIRVYSRDSDPRVVGALGKAFDKWCEEQWNGKVQAATPSRAAVYAARADLLGDRFDPLKKKRKLLYDVQNLPHLPYAVGLSD